MFRGVGDGVGRKYEGRGGWYVGILEFYGVEVWL